MKYLTRQEELVLLAVYQLRENVYLVTIRKFLKKYTGRNWAVGTVYVPLDRLDRTGYLKSYIGEATAKRGRNAIKYYGLTEKGLQALVEIKKVNDIMWEGFSDIAYTI